MWTVCCVCVATCWNSYWISDFNQSSLFRLSCVWWLGLPGWITGESRDKGPRIFSMALFGSTTDFCRTDLTSHQSSVIQFCCLCLIQGRRAEVNLSSGSTRHSIPVLLQALCLFLWQLSLGYGSVVTARVLPYLSLLGSCRVCPRLRCAYLSPGQNWYLGTKFPKKNKKSQHGTFLQFVFVGYLKPLVFPHLLIDWAVLRCSVLVSW